MIARSQANQGSSLWSFLCSFLFGSSDVSSVFDFEVASPECRLLDEALAPIIVANKLVVRTVGLRIF